MNTSKFTGFLKTHTRLLLIAIALLAVLGIVTNSFFLQNRTATHAASPPTGGIRLYANSSPSAGIGSYGYRNLTQRGSAIVCTNVPVGSGKQVVVGKAAPSDFIIIAEDKGPNCSTTIVDDFVETIPYNTHYSCFANFANKRFTCG